MNVIVINDFAETNGGAAQVALASARGLADNGHHVTVFSAVTPAIPMAFHPNLEYVVTGQQEIALDPRRFRAMVQGIWNSRARRQLRITLRKFEPNNTIVHLHGWTKALSSSVVRECVARGFRVVCTLHDYFIACPNGGFYNFRTKSICRLNPMSRACVLENCDSRSYPQKAWRVARQIVQHRFGGIPSHINAFISVSDFSQAILEPFLPSNGRIFRVANPIEGNRGPPSVIEDDAPFLFVGRLSPEKGGVLLAAAARQLACPLVFVGEGSARSEIEAANPEARFTGWLTRTAATEQLRRARAVVLPSLWYETQGMVVLEAAALGIPAVVADSSAARDLVVDQRTGLHFRGGNIDSLRDAMQRLLSTPAARELGHAAYDAYWRAPPTLLAHVSQLERVYADTLEAAVA